MNYRLNIVFPEQVFRHILNDKDNVEEALDGFKNGNFLEIMADGPSSYIYDLSKAIAVFYDELEEE
jgi:hypothetical protein